MIKTKKAVRALIVLLLVTAMSVCTAFATSGSMEVEIRIPFKANVGAEVFITPVDGAPQAQDQMRQADSAGKGEFVLTYTEPGTYKYKITQNSKTFNVSVYVLYNENAQGGDYLSASTVIYNGNTNEKVTKPDFYVPPPSGDKGPSTGESVSAMSLVYAAAGCLTISAALMLFVKKQRKSDTES